MMAPIVELLNTTRENQLGNFEIHENIRRVPGKISHAGLKTEGGNDQLVNNVEGFNKE